MGPLVQLALALAVGATIFLGAADRFLERGAQVQIESLVGAAVPAARLAVQAGCGPARNQDPAGGALVPGDGLPSYFPTGYAQVNAPLADARTAVAAAWASGGAGALTLPRADVAQFLPEPFATDLVEGIDEIEVQRSAEGAITLRLRPVAASPAVHAALAESAVRRGGRMFLDTGVTPARHWAEIPISTHARRHFIGRGAPRPFPGDCGAQATGSWHLGWW